MSTWHFCWAFCVFALGRIVLVCQVCAPILSFCGNIAMICAHPSRSSYRFNRLPDIILASFPAPGHPDKLPGKGYTSRQSPLYALVWRVAVGWGWDVSPLLFFALAVYVYKDVFLIWGLRVSIRCCALLV